MSESPRFIRPVPGRVTSPYGEQRPGGPHLALDLQATTGEIVRASATGTVTSAGWNNGGYGNLVTIDHGSGWETYYAHNSSVLVQRGQNVSAGTPIAKAGSTGDSTGPHVHWEVRRNGQKVNPDNLTTQTGFDPLETAGAVVENVEGVAGGAVSSVLDPLTAVGELLGKLADGRTWLMFAGAIAGAGLVVVGLVLINRDGLTEATSAVAAAYTGGASKAVGKVGA